MSDNHLGRVGKVYHEGSTISVGIKPPSIDEINKLYPLADPVNTQWVFLGPQQAGNWCSYIAYTYVCQGKLWKQQLKSWFPNETA